MDIDNYVRFERAATYRPGPNGGLKGEILVENCKAGKPGKAVSLAVSNKEVPITLRMQRSTDLVNGTEEVICSYSPDGGKTWIKVKQFPVELPGTVKVGISASNASLREFPARFEDFVLNPPHAPGTGKAG